MLATVHTASLHGIDSHPVEVEARYGAGLPGVEIVGLPETAVRESRVRVRAALDAAQVQLPSRKVVLNLAPADRRKSGSALDLPIALALTTAAGVTPPARLERTLVLGELSLDGSLRAVRGVLPHLERAAERGFEMALVPSANAHEAALCEAIDVRCAETLVDVLNHLMHASDLPRPQPAPATEQGPPRPDLSEVRGHPSAKRAMEIAVAGGHNLLLLGPPGTGKTMLARRMGSLLPPLSRAEAVRVATIHSASGQPLPARLEDLERPFRAPHHSASMAALVGGGAPLRPGEVTLAHGGVLFLDELPEFTRSTLESLRPTMESGVVELVRARERVRWPAAPLVVAAMNPCPCGYLEDRTRLCRCSPDAIARYRARISGPLLDRFDLQVRVEPQPARVLRCGERGEPSETVRARVLSARAFAENHAHDADGGLEGLLRSVEPDAVRLLDRAVDRLGMSTRGYAKALRVARTIADLAGEARVQAAHLAESLGYRRLDHDPDAARGAA